MSERLPSLSEKQMTRLEVAAMDAARLNKALNEDSQTMQIKLLPDGSTERRFAIRILIDTRSGRVIDADCDDDRWLQVTDTQTLFSVPGTLRQRLNDAGKLTEEEMHVGEPAPETTVPPSPNAQRQLQDTLDAWQESRTIYVVKR